MPIDQSEKQKSSEQKGNNIISLFKEGYANLKNFFQDLFNTKKDTTENLENLNSSVSQTHSDKERGKRDKVESGKADGIKAKEDKQYEEKYGVTLIRDHKLTFYKVKKGDSLSKIRDNLKKINEFSYLKDSIYNVPSNGSRNIRGFNIPNNALTPGFLLPIPQKIEERKVSIEKFKEYGKTALQEMKNDQHYGKKIKEMVSNLKKSKISEDDIIKIMTAYARSETAEDFSMFSDEIGEVGLSRREKSFKCFSFSYFHILMEKNADGKTPGPGLKARQTLGYTEGECYEPIKACKLFLAYCCEKMSNPESLFNITSLNDAKKAGRIYNGSSKYGEKLRANIKHIKQQK